jgi:hypothetical protein
MFKVHDIDQLEKDGFKWVRIKFSFKKSFHSKIFIRGLVARNAVGMGCVN